LQMPDSSPRRALPSRRYHVKLLLGARCIVQ